jgi:EpsI family protein
MAVKIPPARRTGLIIAVLLGAATVVWQGAPRKQDADKTVDLPSFVPARFSGWQSLTHDSAGYQDQWKSINELLLRTYYRGRDDFLHLIVEYSSDLRQNFSFHFPENCHRAGGNEVFFLEPLEVRTKDGRVFRSKAIYIRGAPGTREPVDKVTAYWVTLDRRRFHTTFWLKLDQMFSGLLGGAREGFLVRVDFTDRVSYYPESIARAREDIARFLSDFYDSLTAQDKDALWGG